MDILHSVRRRFWFPTDSRQQPFADFVGVRWKRESFCAPGVGSGQMSGSVRNYHLHLLCSIMLNISWCVQHNVPSHLLRSLTACKRAAAVRQWRVPCQCHWGQYHRHSCLGWHSHSQTRHTKALAEPKDASFQLAALRLFGRLAGKPPESQGEVKL